MFGSFGWMELLLILFIVLIVFGAGKIPQLGEGLGKAIKGFKKSVQDSDETEGSSQPSADAVHPSPHETVDKTIQVENSPANDQKEATAQVSKPVNKSSEENNIRS